MDIESIWEDFCSRMAEIELYARSAKEVAQEAKEKLQKYETDEVPKLKKLIEPRKSNLSINELITTSHVMYYPDALTGNLISYKMKILDINDSYHHIWLQLNKQYQWLIAEAYEEYEDYLEMIYAYYGKKNKSFWPLKDYGNITLSEVQNMNYQWYVEQSKKKKDIPHSVLNRFRIQFDELRKTELNNELGINLKLAVILIEKLRHIIVHKGGKVDSKIEFVKLVSEKSGLYNNGKISKDTNDFITLFFGKNEYSNLITILDIRVKGNEVSQREFNISLIERLMGYLMAHANLLYLNVKNA